MGATHFLTKTMPRVSAEMSLHVLAYNLKRLMRILASPERLKQCMPEGIAFLLRQLEVASDRRKQRTDSYAVGGQWLRGPRNPSAITTMLCTNAIQKEFPHGLDPLRTFSPCPYGSIRATGSTLANLPCAKLEQVCFHKVPCTRPAATNVV